MIAARAGQVQWPRQIEIQQRPALPLVFAGVPPDVIEDAQIISEEED